MKVKKSIVAYIVEFLVVTAIVINQIQFLVFSLAGINYDPETGGGLVAKLNILFFLICIGWVCFQKLIKKSVHKVRWPIMVIALIIFIFLFESTIFDRVNLDSFAGKQFLFFGTTSVPAIILATFIYNYNRFDMITRNMDVIMLLCTAALALNIPNMMSTTSFQTIGGAGGHQEISYNAAFCFAINLTNLLSGNKENRFLIFTNKFFKYIFVALLPLQAIICILGGGRGGGVLLIFSFLVSLFIYSRKNFGKTILLGLMAVGAFILIVSESGLFSEGFGRTFNYLQGGVFSLENDASDMERTALRQFAFRIISDSPIWGYGLWNGLIVAGYYMHNIFLDILIAGGLILMFLLLFLMRRVYKSIYHMLMEHNDMCMILPLSLLPTTMLMFSGYYMSNALFWFCTIYALLWRQKDCCH